MKKLEYTINKFYKKNIVSKAYKKFINRSRRRVNTLINNLPCDSSNKLHSYFKSVVCYKKKK